MKALWEQAAPLERKKFTKSERERGNKCVAVPDSTALTKVQSLEAA